VQFMLHDIVVIQLAIEYNTYNSRTFVHTFLFTDRSYQWFTFPFTLLWPPSLQWPPNGLICRVCFFWHYVCLKADVKPTFSIAMPHEWRHSSQNIGVYCSLLSHTMQLMQQRRLTCRLAPFHLEGGRPARVEMKDYSLLAR